MSQQYFDMVSANYAINNQSITQNNAKYSKKEPAHQHLEEASGYYRAVTNGIESDVVELPYATETIHSPNEGYNCLVEHSAIPAAKELTRFMNEAVGLDNMVQTGLARIEAKTRALLAIHL